MDRTRSLDTRLFSMMLASTLGALSLLGCTDGPGTEAEPDDQESYVSPYTHLDFSTEGLSTDADCGGPCEPVVVTSCKIGKNGRHYILAQASEDEPVYTSHSNCDDPTPPHYRSGYVRSSMMVATDIYGGLPEGKPVEVIFPGGQFAWLDWSKDDFLLIALRQHDGEWFATATYHVEPSTQGNVGKSGSGNDEASPSTLSFGFPSEIAEFRAELERVETDFAMVCPDITQGELTETQAHLKFRESEPCSAPVDPYADAEEQEPDVPKDGM